VDDGWEQGLSDVGSNTVGSNDEVEVAGFAYGCFEVNHFFAITHFRDSSIDDRFHAMFFWRIRSDQHANDFFLRPARGNRCSPLVLRIRVSDELGVFAVICVALLACY
jgi:hypothetical protein